MTAKPTDKRREMEQK